MQPEVAQVRYAATAVGGHLNCPPAASGCPMTATTECGRREGRSSTTSLPEPAFGGRSDPPAGVRSGTVLVGSLHEQIAESGALPRFSRALGQPFHIDSARS